jgi:hypothetical protein
MPKFIGGLNEKDVLAIDYVEAPESGQSGYSRIYDSSQAGWMRRSWVKFTIYCYKRDLVTVMGLIPTNPTNLTTTGGTNNNGTAATRLSWGAGYVLRSVNSDAVSPGVLKLSCQYEKDISEAQEVYPSGLTVSCVSGVYSVKWQGVEFRSYDNGLGACGVDGLTFTKRSQVKRYVTAYTPDTLTPHVNFTVQDFNRWYNILDIAVDGVVVETNEVKVRQEALSEATSEAYDAGQDLEVVHSETSLGTSYGAELYWAVENNTCNLIWSGEQIWSFSN